VKGIKECVSWMIDNVGKSITNGAEEQTRYQNWKFEFKSKTGNWVDLYNFHVFAALNWEPVREPVDVKEAMMAHEDGKTIKSVCNDGVGSVYKDSDLYDQFGTIISCNEIANGTWYILD